jgi:pimeloyl-ACP methyl ester carboxylesterase
VAFERFRLDEALRARSNHAVVLLHGLVRAKDSMRSLARAMEDAGYEVLDINYPSTRGQIDDFASQIGLVLERTIGIDVVSFVTHSLGGIVLRALLSKPDARWRKHVEVQRALMVFPPNQGASVADKWRDHPVARAVMGPVLGELGKEEPPSWPAPNCPFAIIAGSRDRTVSLSDAWHPEADEVQLLDVEHTFGIADPTLIEAAVRYIDTGTFATRP